MAAETITRLTARDFDEAMDFMNLVFSAAYRPHDFANLLPSLYRPTDEHMRNNYVIRRGGRIGALVGMFPLTWQLGDTTLRVAGIGGVSTHARWRGSGMMREIMEHCVDLMRTEGYHASWLGGARQRYRHFGYEVCGTAVGITMTKGNARAAGDDVPALSFEPLTAEDSERLAQAQKLHDAQPMRAVRDPADFHLLCRSWHNRPQVALDASGNMVGYIVTNAGGEYVAECVAGSDEETYNLLRAWVLQRDGDSVSFDVGPLPSGLLRRLGQWCEHVHIKSSGNWQIFDWPAVLGALLRVRHAAMPLPPGTVVIGVIGVGHFRLEVSGTAAAVTAVKAPAQVEADPCTMLRLLLGPLKPSQVLPLPARAAILDAWCPLPARWTGQDGV